eukprot:6214807-Pleurochrysis_carterae.AAC.8
MQERYVAIFTEIVERTARLVAHWQRGLEASGTPSPFSFFAAPLSGHVGCRIHGESMRAVVCRACTLRAELPRSHVVACFR